MASCFDPLLTQCVRHPGPVFRQVDLSRAFLGDADRTRKEEGAEDDQDDARGDEPAGCAEVPENANRKANQHQRDVRTGAVRQLYGEWQE